MLWLRVTAGCLDLRRYIAHQVDELVGHQMRHPGDIYAVRTGITAGHRWGWIETADLPIFRTPVQCPSPIGTVRDQRRNVVATVGGHPPTLANETEKETGPRAPTAPFDTGL